MNTASLAANAGAVARLALLRRAAGGAAVLGYHDVAPDDRFDEHYTVSAAQLRLHVTVLRDLGLAVVPLQHIVQRHAAGASTDGVAAITFDDALVGVHRHALEVLADLGAPATVFVVTDALGVAPAWWPDAQRTMTIDELRTAHEAGVSLEAHSSRHASLPSLSPAELDADFARCRRMLHDEFGSDASVLAYPFGHHDGAVRAAARGAGFAAAFTFLNGRARPGDDPYRLPRLTAHRGLDRFTLARHLARAPQHWPDHQADRVVDGGPSAAPSAGASISPTARP